MFSKTICKTKIYSLQIEHLELTDILWGVFKINYL